MLKLECINFPITFNSNASGEITFNTKDNGVWYDGEVSTIGLDHFIKQHNIENPENSRKKGYYYYSMGNEQNTYKCTQIENMPIGATLKGVQLDIESWLELTIEPKSIEVHDDIITLVTGRNASDCRVSIKRETLVRYEVK